MKKNLLKLSCHALLLAFTSCSSCKKEIDALPPETQTGANTFGCLIDGKAYIPQKNSGFGAVDPVRGAYINGGSNVLILTKGGGKFHHFSKKCK